MKKFAFIGAGSLQFTGSCMRDLLTFPAFRDCEIALMDINETNLQNIYRVCLRIREAMNCPDCKVTMTTSRAEALKGADGVLCTVFNGNVPNHGAISNLPWDSCVEVPVVADRMGFRTTMVGDLPAHLAILVNTTARIESLVVEAAMHHDKEAVYHAVDMDPLCAAVCSLQEIRSMCDELFEINKDFLGDYR